MKKQITLIILFLVNTIIVYSQTTLTIDVKAGNLKDSIPEEIRPTLVNLILKGSMNDDDFYFMRDKLPKLKNIDLQEVVVDSIPDNAFSDKWLTSIVLPRELKYMGGGAKEIEEITFTGKFPELGEYAFGTSYWRTGQIYHVSEGNNYCKLVNNKNKYYIYSKDEKTLYTATYGGEIPLTVKEIGSRAYEACYLDMKFYLPESIRKIHAYAFYAVGFNLPDNGLWDIYMPLICMAKNPPILEGKVFDEINIQDSFFSMLYVPVGSSELYKAAPQWNQFKIIKEAASPEEALEDVRSNCQNPLLNHLTLRKEYDKLVIKNDIAPINLVTVFSLEGRKLLEKRYSANEVKIDLNGIKDNLIFLRIISSQGKQEIIKYRP